ncbi:hypothetical protein LOK49_LG04G00489 [Camellia lanceoleosa]|uniref:Uncharacterized protein n=1 Tax=Camellia lanceoleosa TaxID=1840588 RepID=A0ACC0HY25_9ERIC|nr:hypothetical protein LOK49_LG04G00489 [Camellia lanceoleosa]
MVPSQLRWLSEKITGGSGQRNGWLDVVKSALRGATTLKARSGCKNKLNGSTPVLPIEENNDFEFDLEKCKSILAKGSELNIETSNGRCMVRSVSIVLTNEGKVIIKIRKLNLLNAFASKKESNCVFMKFLWPCRG